MRNRAKCKLCKTVIESVTTADYIMCACGEIAVSGGLSEYQAFANDYANFVRLDEEGKEVPVKYIDKRAPEKTDSDQLAKPTRKELLDELNVMIQNIEKLPPHALSQSPTHYDLCSALLLLSAILRAET